MSSNYTIDLQVAKNTKLFKKFMESKNKSAVNCIPKIENISIYSNQRNKFQDQNQQLANQNQQQQFTFAKKNEQKNKQGFASEKMHQPLTKDYKKSYQNQNFSNQRPEQIKQIDEIKCNQKLLNQYNQLKYKVTQQRKQHKKQMIKLQQLIDQLNKKVFQLRTKQDELILQNKRNKEKYLAESKQKQQMQEINKELSYQIQQLKDMLDGKENSSKIKEDEASHWRKINDEFKQKIKQLQSQIYRMKDLNNVMEKEKIIAQKNFNNKELHLNQMRQKINNLITENGALKDQIYYLNSKIYNYQNQNKTLRADLKRHSDTFPIKYIKEQPQLSSLPQKQHYTPYENVSNHKIKQNHPQIEKKTQRRRGQFARQREMKKSQPASDIAKINIQNSQFRQVRSLNSQYQNKQTTKHTKKLQELNQQLQKLKDMKAMNGSLRRQKINIEREIQQIQDILRNTK